MIITDDVTFEPVLDFEAYSNTLVDIIKQSYPKFSIGIYGEWGSGKSKLMKVLEGKLRDDDNLMTVWFNAWRYEREDQFAVVALLKTIAYAMEKHPIYKDLKPILLRAVKIFTKGFLSQVASKYIGEKGVEEFKTQLLPQMDLLAEMDKDTIYFDGIRKIEDEIQNIIRKNPLSRIVVFIDDLDRCSPQKALEVFESIKVFLDIDGFVYVIGLSYETISKLITATYKESGITGEQYIKKIIQIPIIIPEWNNHDIRILIEDLLKRNLIHGKYQTIIKENINLIVEAVENNPRELKRFINNFIVAYEIYSKNEKVAPKELLVVQAIHVRWSNFYRLMVNFDIDFHKEVKLYTQMSDDIRLKKLKETNDIDLNLNQEYRKELQAFASDLELWKFLKKQSNTIFSIEDWTIYRRAVESIKAFPTATNIEI